MAIEVKTIARARALVLSPMLAIGLSLSRRLGHLCMAIISLLYEIEPCKLLGGSCSDVGKVDFQPSRNQSRSPHTPPRCELPCLLKNWIKIFTLGRLGASGRRLEGPVSSAAK